MYLLLAVGPMDERFRGSLWTTAMLQRVANRLPQAYVAQPAAVSYTMAYIATPAYPTYAPPPTTAPPTVSPLFPSTTAAAPALPSAPMVRVTSYAFFESFQQIGQALWALTFAFMGGVFAGYLNARNRNEAHGA
jgi:hypothetical protein